MRLTECPTGSGGQFVSWLIKKLVTYRAGVGRYRPWVYHRGMINYLKIDPTMPEPYGRPLWLPVIQAGTPFETSAQAETVKTQIPGATGVVESAGAWYVVKDSVSNRVRKIYLTQHEG